MRVERTITAVDAHACGEPGRVIIGGVYDVPGNTMFDKKNCLEREADWLRKLMLREPRGYPASCCNVVLPPTIEGAAAGYVIMEQTEYPPMSGTNTICVVTVLIETGIVPYTEPVTAMLLDTPAGAVEVRAEVRQGKVTSVTFRNVPAFAVHLDAPLEVPGLGTVPVDVAYGGMWYAIADATAFGLLLLPDEARDIARIGELIRAAAREQLPVAHPENPEICGVSITELTLGMKNAVVVATGTGGALDRSPCGTGTCARMAALHAKGKLPLHQDFVHAGILGTTFTGRLVEQTTAGPYAAVVPELSGRAWITGYAQYVLDPSDPFPEGFTVGDIW
jgi:proline racemase